MCLPCTIFVRGFNLKEKNMSTMVAMEGLWQYLRTLPRSNKQWLSERLQEDLHPKAATTDAGIDAGLKDLKAGRTVSFEDFIKNWNDEV